LGLKTSKTTSHKCISKTQYLTYSWLIRGGGGQLTYSWHIWGEGQFNLCTASYPLSPPAGYENDQKQLKFDNHAKFYLNRLGCLQDITSVQWHCHDFSPLLGASFPWCIVGTAIKT